MPQRSKRWIWAGRLAATMVMVAIGVFLWSVGLTAASAIGSAFGLLVGLAALMAPYLFPVQSAPKPSVIVTSSGSASARQGGKANTGFQSALTGNLRVDNSGKAEADGVDSVANTGIQEPTTRNRD